MGEKTGKLAVNLRTEPGELSAMVSAARAKAMAAEPSAAVAAATTTATAGIDHAGSTAESAAGTLTLAKPATELAEYISKV
jgi:hypothetical protein